MTAQHCGVMQVIAHANPLRKGERGPGPLTQIEFGETRERSNLGFVR